MKEECLICGAPLKYLENDTAMELKAAAESEDKILAKTVARQIQPKLEEMQHANPFKKAFLILKYLVLGNRNAKCTIPREALASYVRTILPDIYAFFESEEGNRQYEEWLKEEEKNETGKRSTHNVKCNSGK